MTSTVPVPAGDEETLIVLSSITEKAAEAAPKWTAVVPVKFDPLMVTTVPPVVPPPFGNTDDIVGGGTTEMPPQTDVALGVAKTPEARTNAASFFIVPSVHLLKGVAELRQRRAHCPICITATRAGSPSVLAARVANACSPGEVSLQDYRRQLAQKRSAALAMNQDEFATSPLQARPPPSAAAMRMRRHRERRRLGLRFLGIELRQREINALIRREQLPLNERTDPVIRKALYSVP